MSLLEETTMSACTEVEPVEVQRDVVDEWGCQSFPASDPPQNW